jgi:hypothetical protein
MLADHRWIRLLSINSVCVVPRCKGGGIKALRAAAVVHNTSPVGGKGGGGPAGALAARVHVGARPQDARGAESQMMAPASVARLSGEWGDLTPMCRVAARCVAPARGSALWRRCPVFKFKVPMFGRLILLNLKTNSKSYR